MASYGMPPHRCKRNAHGQEPSKEEEWQEARQMHSSFSFFVFIIFQGKELLEERVLLYVSSPPGRALAAEEML